MKEYTIKVFPIDIDGVLLINGWNVSCAERRPKDVTSTMKKSTKSIT